MSSYEVETEESAQSAFDSIQRRLSNIQKEKEILGHIFNKPEDQIQILTETRAQYFHNPNHAHLFELIQRMFQDKMDLTHVSIREYVELKAQTKNKALILEVLHDIASEQLTDTVFNTIQFLRELTNNRKVYSEILVRGNIMFQDNQPIEEIVDHMAKALVSVEGGRKEIPMKDAATTLIDSILNPHENDAGLLTGISAIDAQFGGIKKDRYYTIGGESGGGKTGVIVDMMDRLIERHRDKIKILFFSMEMSEQRIAKRFISRKTNISGQTLEIKKYALEESQKRKLKEAAVDLQGYPIEIVYATMNCQQIKMRVRKFAIENKDKHLIIALDHIGLVTGDTNDMRVNTIQASSMMKSFCRDHDASVFVLTQFTKEIDSSENRKNYHRPHMGYIMESGRIRQDSDAVWLLWRPETRFATIAYAGEEAWDTHNRILFLNEKNRDGHAPNDIVLNHNIGCSKILNPNEVL